MARAKVKLADNIARVVFIETEATIGATIGRDLKLPNGQVATVDSLRSLLGVQTDASGQPAQHHRLLQGLNLGDDHPQYVRKDLLTVQGDMYVRGLTTVSRLPLGTTGQILRSNGTDALWATVSPVITLGTDLSGNVTLTALANGTLNATIVNNAVTDAKLRDSGGLSVIGRSASTTGDPADILAASDGDVLRRSGATVGFGRITAAATAFAATDRVLGRDTAGAGNGEELTLSQVLDFIGSAAHGDILYRGASVWERLGAGTDLYVLQTRGPGANPRWTVMTASSLVYNDPTVPSGNTIDNTTSEMPFSSSYSVPVTELLTGTILRVRLFGVYSTDSSPPTLRIRVKLAGTTVFDTGAFTTTASMTDRGWQLESYIAITDEGVSGEVEAQGYATFSSGDATAQVVHAENTAPISVTLSSDATLEMSAQWGTADADNSITLRQAMVNIERTTIEPPLAVYALLHFDDADASTTFTDQTGKQWVRQGDAQIDTSQSVFGGSSLLLDGTGDGLKSMTDQDFVFGTGDFTIEGWVRYDTLSGNNFMFAFGAGWGVYTFGGNWAVFDGAASNAIGPAGSTAADVWYHVALCRSGTSLRLFIDGVQVGSTATNSTDHASAPIYLGTQPAGTGRMTGWIDEFRIVGSALYTSNFTPPAAPFDDPVIDTSVVSLLHFDGTDGSTTFTDEMGKTWTAAGTAQLDTAQFKFGTASLLLDGTDDYITSPDADDVSLGDSDFTIECWVRFNGDPGTAGMTFISHWEANSPANQRGWIFGLNNNTLRFVYSTNGTSSTTLSAAWNPATATWYHAAVSRRGSTVYFFIDGALLGTASIGSAVIFDANSTLQIGTQSNGADFDLNGWVDDARVTVGHVWYLSAFTPPDQPFPNP